MSTEHIAMARVLVNSRGSPLMLPGVCSNTSYIVWTGTIANITCEYANNGESIVTLVDGSSYCTTMPAAELLENLKKVSTNK